MYIYILNNIYVYIPIEYLYMYMKLTLRCPLFCFSSHLIPYSYSYLHLFLYVYVCSNYYDFIGVYARRQIMSRIEARPMPATAGFGETFALK